MFIQPTPTTIVVHASKDGWDYASTIAITVSAAATAILALFTRGVASRTEVLAGSTRDLADYAKQEVEAVLEQGESIKAQADAVELQAKAAAEQVALTRQSLLASTQPWLTIGYGSPLGEHSGQNFVDPPVQVGDVGGDIRASVQVHNVGNGLAIIDPSSSRVLGWGTDSQGHIAGPREFSHGSVANPVLPTDQQVFLQFVVNKAGWQLGSIETFLHQKEGLAQGTTGQFYADIVYGDALSERKTRARFQFASDPQAGWVTVGIEYFSPTDAASPETTVRFR